LDSPFDTYWESTKAAVDEVIAVLAREECGDHVLIGGDFNILAGRARVGQGDGDVLQSLKDLGYVECVEAGLSCEGHVDTRTEADLLACDCQRGVRCTHSRTFYSSGSPLTPHQDDYLFASEALAGLLKDCWVPSVGPGSYSDHAPIVSTCEVP
jgi:endonuclease/exonuclease/phosphatase family metal-dependent hydrolase